MRKSINLAKKFLTNKKGTPSIETVAIVAFVALAIFGSLGSLGSTVGNVFGYVTNQLSQQIK